MFYPSDTTKKEALSWALNPDLKPFSVQATRDSECQSEGK